MRAVDGRFVGYWCMFKKKCCADKSQYLVILTSLMSHLRVNEWTLTEPWHKTEICVDCCSDKSLQWRALRICHWLTLVKAVVVGAAAAVAGRVAHGVRSRQLPAVDRQRTALTSAAQILYASLRTLTFPRRSANPPTSATWILEAWSDCWTYSVWQVGSSAAAHWIDLLIPA